MREIGVYFDFDGTLTTKDTLIAFLIHCVGWTKFILNLPRILPNGILYLFNFISNEEAKQRTLTILLKGYSFEQINKKAKSFAYTGISKYIKPEIFARLEYHKEHKHKVILVSANLAIYLNYWAAIHQLDGVVATEIEFIAGIASGRLATRNCYAKQKVLRLEQYLQENSISVSYSYGYGNSPGDYELLNYVDEGYCVEGEEFIPWADKK